MALTEPAPDLRPHDKPPTTSGVRRAASSSSATVRGWPWTVRAGAAVFVVMVAVLALTPWIAPYDPAAQDLAQRLAGPSGQHWLGTDQLGRDVLSRLMYGGRFSVSIAAVTLLLSVVVGTLIGAFSARVGGMVDEFLMRVVDLLISIPDVVVALFLIAVFGTGYGTLISALTIVGWTPFARLMRGLALEINSRDFIEAAEALGCSRSFIIVRHVIPNAMRPLTALSFLRFGHKLITVGGLSFIGLGVQPPDSDWGAMLLDAQPYMEQMPLLVMVPGLAIFLTALSVSLIGQGVEPRDNKQ
ncbi:ABC transporter permease [Streptomyces sp. NPDC088116]|uniref:ABC transporter permease n=1 Tax=Streptomyces sp. NPDC088116 TaxID=3365825 RepID=UPI0038299C98